MQFRYYTREYITVNLEREKLEEGKFNDVFIYNHIQFLRSFILDLLTRRVFFQLYFLIIG